MTGGDKWNEIKLYLAKRDKQLISEIRTNARKEELGQLPRMSAQLTLLEDIIAQVERLDRDQVTGPTGRPAPPKQKY